MPCLFLRCTNIDNYFKLYAELTEVGYETLRAFSRKTKMLEFIKPRVKFQKPLKILCLCPTSLRRDHRLFSSSIIMDNYMAALDIAPYSTCEALYNMILRFGTFLYSFEKSLGVSDCLGIFIKPDYPLFLVAEVVFFSVMHLMHLYTVLPYWNDGEKKKYKYRRLARGHIGVPLVLWFEVVVMRSVIGYCTREWFYLCFLRRVDALDGLMVSSISLDSSNIKRNNLSFARDVDKQRVSALRGVS